MTCDEWLKTQPDLPEEVADTVRHAWGFASAEGVEWARAKVFENLDEWVQQEIRSLKRRLAWREREIAGWKAALRRASDIGRMKVELVDSGEAFAPGDDYHDDVTEEEGYADGQLRLNLNDFFAWACSDAEAVPDNLVEEVHRVWRAFPGEDAVGAWCSIRRGMLPQPPVLEERGGPEKWNDLCSRVRAMMAPDEGHDRRA